MKRYFASFAWSRSTSSLLASRQTDIPQLRELTGLPNTLFSDGDRLNPAIDAFFSRQSKHVKGLLPTAKVTAPDKTTVTDQALGRDAPALALWEPDGNELSVYP